MGDTTHGDNAQNRAVAAHTGSTRLMLHARTLAFNKPDGSGRITVCADVDGQWQQLARAFGWQIPPP